MSNTLFAERRGFVEDRGRRTGVPVAAVATRKARKARPEPAPADEGDRLADEGDRPESGLRFRKRGEVKQLANKSINYSAFVIATLIPAAWLVAANLLQYALTDQLFPSPYRLIAVGTGVVWGCIIAWVTNVPQVLYFYRPGGRNKNQRRLFVLSVLGLFVSLSALVILGLLPIIIGCAKPWRYIYITDPRGVYIAYTGQVLQPNTLYRTGLTWKTPALEHHLES